MPPEELIRQMTDIAEKEEMRKRKAREKKIQRAIVREVAACQRKMKKREGEIRLLEVQIGLLKGKQQFLRARVLEWRLKSKKWQLDELRKITPSPGSSTVRRMLGGQ